MQGRRDSHECSIFRCTADDVFAIPLLIVAIGAMYSERSGVINIALEGIMVMGAFAGIFFINIFQGTLSGQGLFLLAMLVAGLTGGLFSLLHAFASINMKADQTISGTALNLFAPAFAIFTARYDPGNAADPVYGHIPYQ